MEYGSAGNDEFHRPAIINVIIAIIIFNVVICCCPHSAVAQRDSNLYIWEYDHWGPCIHETCGPGGRQFRSVKCIVRTGLEVDPRNCRPDARPRNIKECEKPCHSADVRLDDLDRSEVNPSGRVRPGYGQEVSEGGRGYGTSDRWGYGDSYGESGRDYGLPGGGDFVGTSPTSDVEWVVYMWSSCRLPPGSTTCGRGNGIRTREITCELKLSSTPVDPSRCLMMEDRPSSVEPCEYLCRQDCVVTEYSDWSGCDETCQLSKQTRVREVVIPPRHQGSICPDLSEFKDCDNCTHSHTYKFGEWQPCHEVGGVGHLIDVPSHPIVGYQSRDITCLQGKGDITAMSFCSRALPDVILQYNQACVMPQDCIVSDWSDAVPYNDSCKGADGRVHMGFLVMTRQVLQLPMGSGRPCPASLIEYIPVTGDMNTIIRPCRRTRWVYSSWSTCQPITGHSQCDTGLQTRRAICVEGLEDGSERPVRKDKCQDTKANTSRSCPLVCNWDCAVSHWGPWSDCETEVCSRPGPRRKRFEPSQGKRYRERTIITMPGPNGKQCPHLVESRLCIAPPCFSWNITLWPCEATTRGGCGDGTRRKKAICQDSKGNNVGQLNCLSHESPPHGSWVECHVPCAEDCILSEWSEWSKCPDPCAINVAGMSSRFRMRTILAYSSARSNHPCPGQEALRELESCPTLPDCNVYHWKASPWGECILRGDNVNVRCGLGVQTRSYQCVSMTGVPASESRCVADKSPMTSKECTIDCPVDCRITEWSEWSDCGRTCLPAQARQIYPFRERHRYILQYPDNGGLSCHSDLRQEEMCVDLPACETFYWQPGPWSDCVVPMAVPLCGQGLKARDIKCYHSSSEGTKEVTMTMCLENVGFMPPQTQECYKPCEATCQFSEWSQWTQCGPSCQKSRFRFRELLGPSKENPLCRDTNVYPRDQHEDCMCGDDVPKLKEVWSDCIVNTKEETKAQFAQMSLKSISYRQRRTNDSLSDYGPDAFCGNGKRFQAIACPASGFKPNGERCTGEEYKEEPCFEACPVDCEMEHWTAWSACGARCGSGVEQRERRIKTQPDKRGRRCPVEFGNNKEVQTRVCYKSCTYYVWRVDPWRKCAPAGGRQCGFGTQGRGVRCVAIDDQRRELSSDESLCNESEKPPDVRDCTMPCPGECVLSEWSDWTQCTQPCDGRRTQTRTRKVLRRPAPYAASQNCSDQTAERPCELNKNCGEYQWIISPFWTSCLINGGDAECGSGYMQKFADCKNEHGHKVDEIKCLDTVGEVTEPLITTCEVACSEDCLISHWSEWTSCSATCGMGFSKRHRSVIGVHSGNGRKCDDKMEQTRPCFKSGCYRWHVSDWSPCKSPKGTCGHGIQERNVSCIGASGWAVNASNCPVDPEKLVMQTSRSCDLPCPGECKLTEWSEWSECYISCEDFKHDYRTGVKTRSRAVLRHPSQGNPPCNTTLWEDRRCEAVRCTRFLWKTTEWQRPNKDRDVWCERDFDGLVVLGGCNEQEKPSRFLTCVNQVCITPAKCVDVDVCQCPDDTDDRVETPGPNNTIVVTCIMNTTLATSTTAEGAAKEGSTPNFWMYAVIAVGTLFVIAVTAALYNMCELFRTGPRPRRKPAAETASTTGTLHSVNTLQRSAGNGDVMSGNGGTTTPNEHIYKQIERGNKSDFLDGPEKRGLRGGDGTTVAVDVGGGGGGGGTYGVGVREDVASRRGYYEEASLVPPIYQNSPGQSIALPHAVSVHGDAGGGGGVIGGGGVGIARGVGRGHGDIPDIDAITTTNNTPSADTSATTPSNTTANSSTAPLLAHSINNNNNAGSSSAVNRLAGSSSGLAVHSAGDKVGGMSASRSASHASLRNNRRYKQMHCLLPHRLAMFFSCGNKSSVCMVEGSQSDLDIDPSISRSQSMSLTRAHAIENMELCGGEFHTNTTSGFQSHQCMLPQSYSYELRPHKLELHRQGNILGDVEDPEVINKRKSIPLVDEIDLEIARMSPMMEKTYDGQNEFRTSSDSLAISSDLISGRQEGSSQCSLQLGDTAESLTDHRNKSSVLLPSSAMTRSDHLAPSFYSHHGRPSQQYQQSGRQASLPGVLESPRLDSSNPHLNAEVQRTLGDTLVSTNLRGGHSSPHLARQDDARSSNITHASTNDNLKGITTNMSSFHPLHVSTNHPVDDVLYGELHPHQTSGHPFKSTSHPHPYPSPHIVHVPQDYPSPHSKRPSASPSPHSFSSETPLLSNHSPHHQAIYHNPYDPQSRDTRNGRSYSQNPKQTKNAAQSSSKFHKLSSGYSNLDPPGQSSSSRRIPSSRSSASLPENLLHTTKPTGSTGSGRGRGTLIEKVSQDSGHSTMPVASPNNVSPSGDSLPDENGPADHVFIMKTRAGLSPVRGVLQASMSTSPTPSLCTSCRSHLDKAGVSVQFVPGTPDSSTRLSQISGLETSV